MKPKILVIVGPTAVGKTKTAIELAKIFNGEIISADSMQIYKGMNIGTAKPSIDEMQGIKHYLIDEVEPDYDFSAAEYKERASKYIKEILSKGKLPIIVGGTGLYINSLIYNISFSETVCDNKYRDELAKIARSKGNQYLYDLLKEMDADTANKLHPNDTKRIIRALEVYKFTGKSMSQHVKESRTIPSDYHFIIIGLTINREQLYQRINKRVDLMLENGLLDEVNSLLKQGYSDSNTSMQAIGYKEIIDYFKGKTSLDWAIDIIKQESRRYAKRQFTWFRRIENIKWFDITNESSENFFKNIQEYIAQNLEIM